MKAAINTQYGPPEVVRVGTLPKPEPKDDEVLIRVKYSTVNRTDCGFRSAEYFVSRFFSGLFKPKNTVLGCEFAGEIVQIGQNVSAYSVGDQVFGYDDARFGGHAEYKTIAENGPMALKPANMDLRRTAALTEGSHYALNNIRAANVKAGDIVLVNGSTGAIGSAAVQLLKYFGAYVVAVANTKNLEMVKSLGADEVIDYQTQAFTKTNHRFDFVFDAVGKSSFGQCKPLLKPKGIYISTELGKGGENIFLALISNFSQGKKVLFPIPPSRKEDVELLGQLAAEGKFMPVIDREYTLDDIVEAYHYVETGEKTGNVIIQIS